MRLPVFFTATFSKGHADLPGYDRLPNSDREAVDAMLDRLESEHDQGVMRNVVQVGDVSLYATPVIYTRSGAYRPTWIYDDRDAPTKILVVTVASIET